MGATDPESNMTDHEPDPATTLRLLVQGYQVSQAIHVAATLGIADRLAGGSRSSDELAAVTVATPMCCAS